MVTDPTMNDRNQNTGDTGNPGPDAGRPDSAAELQVRIDELEKKNLRLLADMRNMQQRAMREKEEALKFAESEFARELLVVIDDLERTLDSARSGADAKTLADGVRITSENFVKVLKAHSIEQIDAVGKPFDPGVHEALMQQPSPTVPTGVVMQEVTRGYQMHGRTVRPSRVIVSSGPGEAR